MNGSPPPTPTPLVLKAENIVLATGAWSKNLTAQLGHKIPLQAERGYHLSLKNEFTALSALADLSVLTLKICKIIYKLHEAICEGGDHPYYNKDEH